MPTKNMTMTGCLGEISRVFSVEEIIAEEIQLCRVGPCVSGKKNHFASQCTAKEKTHNIKVKEHAPSEEESTVRKKMVTVTFTYNALCAKTLKGHTKTQRKN